MPAIVSVQVGLDRLVRVLHIGLLQEDRYRHRIVYLTFDDLLDDIFRLAGLRALGR